jgi:hypothetical protein
VKLEKNIGWIVCERWQVNNIKRLERAIAYAIRKRINVYELVRSPIKTEISRPIQDSFSLSKKRIYATFF